MGGISVRVRLNADFGFFVFFGLLYEIDFAALWRGIYRL